MSILFQTVSKKPSFDLNPRRASVMQCFCISPFPYHECVRCRGSFNQVRESDSGRGWCFSTEYRADNLSTCTCPTERLVLKHGLGIYGTRETECVFGRQNVEYFIYCVMTTTVNRQCNADQLGQPLICRPWVLIFGML